MKKVFGISKWNEVFERAESRKLKTLTWVSLPVTVNSNGYQAMLDDFGKDAPAIYGAWCALLSVAAQANVRGVLCNSRGEAMKLSHIARITGFEEVLFERLFEWASSENIAWLTEQNPDFCQSTCPFPDVPPTIPQQSPEHPTRPDLTVSNQTSPNLTQPLAVGGIDGLREKVFGLGWTMDDVRTEGGKFWKRSRVSKKTVDALIAAGIVIADAAVANGLMSDLSDRLKDGSIRKPVPYIKSSITRALSAFGVNADQFLEITFDYVNKLREQENPS